MLYSYLKRDIVSKLTPAVGEVRLELGAKIGAHTHVGEHALKPLNVFKATLGLQKNT